MSLDEYARAQRDGLREAHALKSKKENPYLICLDEILPEINSMSRITLGVRDISMSCIAGTATQGRSTAFSRSFKPLLDANTEFAAKWSSLHDDILLNGMRESIKVLEYYNQYYVIEGNKRVSVSRQIDSIIIEADVTRILPRPDDSPRYQAYQAFLKFNADTGMDMPVLTSPSGYEQLYQLSGREMGTPWDRKDVSELRTAFLFFTQSYLAATKNRPEPLPVGEAFLMMLRVHGYRECMTMSSAEIATNVRQLWQEFIVSASNKPAALIDKPTEKRVGLVQSVLRPQRTLRCAFLYNHTIDSSGWNYWHDLGRRSIVSTFGSRIETTCRDGVTQENAEQVMKELLTDGWDVIFATSPVFLDACIHMSMEHPKAKILNCSLLASYRSVRSYYLRIYEAKFILGALAGILTENDLIGYIADYPICGVPTSINAFALGAKMTNPKAHILLEWSSIPGHDPEAALEESGVSLISGRDISAPNMERSRAFGLYRTEEERLVNLGMPVWNWGKLYQDIIRSIMTDAWDSENTQQDQALRYYMGMNSGSIDIVLSEKLAPAQAHLCSILQSAIAADELHPFSDPLIDQQGNMRIAAGAIPAPDEIIGMNYLADNVVGSIPEISTLTPQAQELVKLHGLKY